MANACSSPTAMRCAPTITRIRNFAAACERRSGRTKFLGLPFDVRDSFANRARKGSKAHNARTAPQIQDVNAAAVEIAYRTARVHRIIHGHTHRPGIHDTVVDGEPAQRIVLGAWYEQGSYLVYENGKYELETLPRLTRFAHGPHGLLVQAAGPSGPRRRSLEEGKRNASSGSRRPARPLSQRSRPSRRA